MMTRKEFILLALITLFGAILRFTHLSALSLWLDEGYTAWAANHSQQDIISLIRADTNPPLYYLLLHFWTHFFGRGEAGLRSLSALAGTLQIPIVYLIARRLLRPEADSQPHPTLRASAPFVATILFALSFAQYWYSREARFYELLCFLTTLSFYFLLRYLDSPRIGWLLLLSVTFATALYTHNMMLAQLPGFAVAAFLLPSRRRPIQRIPGALAFTGMLTLLYFPWLLSLSWQIHRVNAYFWVSRPTFQTLADDLAGLCGIRHLWTWDRYISRFNIQVSTFVPNVTMFFLACSLILAIFTLRQSARRTALALFALALTPPLITAAYSEIGTPIFMMKPFLFSVVPLCILIAAPLAWARPAYAVPWAAIAVFMFAVNVAAFIAEQVNENWRAAAQYVSAIPGDHRLILFVAADGQLPFDYYFAPGPTDFQTGLPHGFFASNPPQAMQRVTSRRDLDPLRKLLTSRHFSQIILVYCHTVFIDPRQLTLGYLTRRYPHPRMTDFDDVQVWQFQPR